MSQGRCVWNEASGIKGKCSKAVIIPTGLKHTSVLILAKAPAKTLTLLLMLCCRYFVNMLFKEKICVCSSPRCLHFCGVSTVDLLSFTSQSRKKRTKRTSCHQLHKCPFPYTYLEENAHLTLRSVKCYESPFCWMNASHMCITPSCATYFEQLMNPLQTSYNTDV